MLDNYYLENCITNIQNNLEGLNSEDFEELIDIFENSTNEFVHSIICNKNNKEQLKNICHKYTSSLIALNIKDSLKYFNEFANIVNQKEDLTNEFENLKVELELLIIMLKTIKK